jgi:hypothetical protein
MIINHDIIDEVQKAKLFDLIEKSSLSADAKRIAIEMINTNQYYKAAHATLSVKNSNLMRELDALRNKP